MPSVLITGANRGLGLAHVENFLAHNWRVHAACRLPAQAEALNALASRADEGALQVHAWDGDDPDASTALAAALGGEAIDVLFNNAGVMGPGSDGQAFGATDPDAMAHVFATNVIAPLRLAEAMVENVAKSERKVIANQSSLMGSIADCGGGFYAYRTSKAALNMVSMALARDLASRGVSVLALHPGWVQTDMGGPSAPLSPAESVAGQFAVIDAAGPAQSGKFFNYDGRELPW